LESLNKIKSSQLHHSIARMIHDKNDFLKIFESAAGDWIFEVRFATNL